MTNLRKITESYQQRHLLIVWAATPFLLPRRAPAQPAQVITRWQHAAAKLPPPEIPLWQLPPLPILSLDPTARLETAFAAPGVPLKPVITRAGVPANGQHTLLKLAGDLPSRRRVILSRADIRNLAGNPDKRHLLTEARHVLGGQGAVLVIGAGAEFAAWWAVVQPALGNPAAFALGAPVGDIPALGATFDELSAALWQAYRHQSQKETPMDTDSLKKQITIQKRRLNILKEQAAVFGVSTPPHILLEIEDIEAKIAELERQITPPPASESPSPPPSGGTVYNINIGEAKGVAIGDGAQVSTPPPEGDEAQDESLE